MQWTNRQTNRHTDKQTDSKILPTPTDIVGVAAWVIKFVDVRVCSPVHTVPLSSGYKQQGMDKTKCHLRQDSTLCARHLN